MVAALPGGIRVLAVLAPGVQGSDVEWDVPLWKHHPLLQVDEMISPTLQDVQEKLQASQPQIVLLSSGYKSGDRGSSLSALGTLAEGETAKQLAQACCSCGVATTIICSTGSAALVEALAESGMSHIVHWPPDFPAAAAAVQLYTCTFFLCVGQHGLSPPEAHCMGASAVKAHWPCPQPLPGPLPELVTDSSAMLPGPHPLPLPDVEGLQEGAGLAPAFHGWEDTRLLAPPAEVLLMLASTPAVASTPALSQLAMVLRALLCAEASTARLLRCAPLQGTPPQLPNGCIAAGCRFRTCSGHIASCVIGAPPRVLSMPQVVEHALRQSLMADASCAKFLLPPPGVAVQPAQTMPETSGDTPLVEMALSCSTLATGLLRHLAKTSPLLRALGVVTVGSAACLQSSAAAVLDPLLADTGPLHVLVPSDCALHKGVTPWACTGVSLPGPTGGAATLHSVHSSLGSSATAATPGRVEPWRSPRGRPPLAQCSNQELVQDVLEFLVERKGMELDPERFPDVIVNGSQLDLATLYREVCVKGGFRAGSAVNWKGHVFPRMANFTANHRMTGVGNALKRHYQNLLLEYEMANAADVQAAAAE